MPFPVIDFFAGPGGLSEGFAQPTRRVSKGSPQLTRRVSKGSPQLTRRVSKGSPHVSNGPFRVALSIEKDPTARETLRLRAFFRQFPPATRNVVRNLFRTRR